MQSTRRRRTKRKVGNRPRFIPMDIENAVQRSIVKRSEKHWSDVTLIQSPLLTTWSFQLLNGISQGDDYNERVGDKITMLTQRVHLFITPDAEPVATRAGLRIVLIYDSQPNGAAPTGDTVFAADTVYRFANHGYRQRFTILKDQFINYDSQTTNIVKWVKWSKKLTKNVSDVRYSGTGATVASIASGSLYLGFCSTAADVVNLEGQTRLVYTDI
uniref:capsid/nuclear shuttle family protein n=1 Tax=Shewanella sp. TaxID=50422 RepID=UPI0040484F00